MTVRRLPVVTITLIFVTIALHALASLYHTGDREHRAMTALVSARSQYLTRPSLGVCAPLKPFVDGAAGIDSSLGEALERMTDETAKRDATERYETACKDLAEALDGLPTQRFGYVPARASFLGLFTYMFVHADFWHVVGNMWFLFLCGLALEDRWGRPAFAAYYIVAGVVAAGVHHLALSNSTAALIGASGAVAGAMGAFLVLFATTKIRFVGFLGFRVVSFLAPAYVMLPLWAGVELLYGLLSSSSGTAHWAHIGGFVFGAAVAAAFRIMGVDKRLDKATEFAAVIGDDPRIDTARALVARGEAAQAVALLEGLAKEKPESSHVQEALRDAQRASSRSTPTAAKAQSVRSSVRASVPSAPAAIAPAVIPTVAAAVSASVEPEGAPFFPPPKRPLNK